MLNFEKARLPSCLRMFWNPMATKCQSSVNANFVHLFFCGLTGNERNRSEMMAFAALACNWSMPTTKGL